MNEIVRRTAGRPTKQVAAAIDAVVLTGARAAFSRQGYASTSMDEIAAATGVTKHTIYRRYPSKAALLEAVVERDLVGLHAIAHIDSGTATDPTERLHHIAWKFFEYGLLPENMQFIDFLMAESAFSDEMQRNMVRWERLATAPLREGVEAMQAVRALRSDDADFVCDLLSDLMSGASVRLRRLDATATMPPQRAVFEQRWGVFARAMIGAPERVA